MKKAKTDQEVMADYDNMPPANKLSTLYDALFYMQQYNGRSRRDCIIMAMGYVPDGLAHQNKAVGDE